MVVIEETLETDVGVHLVFTVDRDWEKDRAGAVEEMERKAAACREYGRSREFRDRFGDRPALVRMKSTYAPPDVVVKVMRDGGVDVEVVHRLRLAPGYTCVICLRGGFAEDEVEMTGRGWACGACFRGWSMLEDAEVPHTLGERRARTWRIVKFLFLVGFVIACVLAAYARYLSWGGMPL